MALLKKLAGETAIYGVSSILSRVLNYIILTPYFTRVFLQGEYGEVSILYTYIAILMVVFTYRMETAFFRYGSRDGNLDKAFSTASFSLIASTVVFSVLVVVFRQPLAIAINYPGHPEYLLLVLGIIVIDTLSAIPFARLRLQNRPIRFAFLKTLQIVLNIIFVFLLLEGFPYLAASGWTGLGALFPAETRVSMVFVANLLASGLVLLFLFPAYFKVRLTFDTIIWRQMVAYALPLVVVGLAAVINQLIALPLLENLLPGTLEENRAQAGIYSAAAKLAILMNLFAQAFNYAAEPFFFNNFSRSDAREVYGKVAQAFAIVGSMVFLGILLYLDVIKYFLGAHLREGLGIVPLLLLAYFLLGLYYNFSIWYKLADRTAIGAYISLGGMVLTLGLNFLLVPDPSVGYYGAAIAALACYAFMTIASYLTGRKLYPIEYPIGKILAYIGVAVACYLISLALRPLSGGALWATLLINTFLMGAYLFGFYRLERKTLRELIRS